MHPNVRAKQKSAIEKPKLDNARRLRSIHIIDPEDEEFKNIMKNARRKLEVPIPAAMLCKTLLCRCNREGCRTIGGHESLRIRMEGAPHRYHEDHIEGKGMNALGHFSRAQIFPVPQAMNIPDAKAVVEFCGKNLRNYRHGSWRKSETKMRWSLKQGMRAETYTLRR